jgi:hypothetical protein
MNQAMEFILNELIGTERTGEMTTSTRPVNTIKIYTWDKCKAKEAKKLLNLGWIVIVNEDTQGITYRLAHR